MLTHSVSAANLPVCVCVCVLFTFYYFEWPISYGIKFIYTCSYVMFYSQFKFTYLLGSCRLLLSHCLIVLKFELMFCFVCHSFDRSHQFYVSMKSNKIKQKYMTNIIYVNCESTRRESMNWQRDINAVVVSPFFLSWKGVKCVDYIWVCNGLLVSFSPQNWDRSDKEEVVTFLINWFNSQFTTKIDK